MPNAASVKFKFSLTLGMYKAQVPMSKLIEVKTQLGAKYLLLDRISFNEFKAC